MKHESWLRARLVWGEKSILDALESLMGWRPSRQWLYDWRGKTGLTRLPVRTMGGSNRLFSELAELAEWWKRARRGDAHKDESALNGDK